MRPAALAGALIGALALAGPVVAQECRLALILALDVSSSVDADEDRLQREGLALALRSPRVVQAMLSGSSVAIHAFEWSGQRAQVPLLPGWQMIGSASDIDYVAGAIAGSRRGDDELPTALGEALGYAAGLLAEAPECRSRTIDVAGDGLSNEGLEPAAAYEAFPLDGVTVNALIVADPVGGAREDGARLIAWFQAEVLQGPGAFSLVAEGYDDYARAMEAKLLRELAVPAVSGLARRLDAG